METPRALLLFLYGLFWAQLLSTTGRYNAFPTAAILNPSEPGRSKRLLRLAVSFFVLDLFPIGWLFVLWQWVVLENNPGFLALAGAAIAALSIFGWLRIYHAIVASRGAVSFFYTDEETSRLAIQGPINIERPHYTHWIPGLMYMTLFPLAGYFVSRL